MLSHNLKMNVCRRMKMSLVVVLSAAVLSGCSFQDVVDDGAAGRLDSDVFLQALEDAGCEYTSHGDGVTVNLFSGCFPDYVLCVDTDVGQSRDEPIYVHMRMIRFEDDHNASTAYDFVRTILLSRSRASSYGESARIDEFDEDGWRYYLLRGNDDGLVQDPLTEPGNYDYYGVYCSGDTVLFVEEYFTDSVYEETDVDRVLDLMDLPKPGDLN